MSYPNHSQSTATGQAESVNGSGLPLWFVYHPEERDALRSQGFDAVLREELQPTGRDVVMVVGAGDFYAISKAPEDVRLFYSAGAKSIRIVQPATSRISTTANLLANEVLTIDELQNYAEDARVEPKGIQLATLADVRRESTGAGWIWPYWIPSARLWGIAAYEGVGKTRFSMDLARRWWFGLAMPDREPAVLPAGTPTLWVCADSQQDDLLEIAAAYGLPDEAVILNTLSTDPYGGTSIDAVEDLQRLESGILTYKPATAFVDTLTNATGRDMCRAEDARRVCMPLAEIAKRTGTAISLDCHLALNGKALGKRVRGWTRTMLEIECPDPDHPERLKIFVEKSFSKRPEPLGATMSDSGTDYDKTPPVAPEKPRRGGGAPPKARQHAMPLIRAALIADNDQIGNELQASLEAQGVTRKTFWRAVEDMEAAGDLITDGGPGSGQQMRLHLNA